MSSEVLISESPMPPRDALAGPIAIKDDLAFKLAACAITSIGIFGLGGVAHEVAPESSSAYVMPEVAFYSATEKGLLQTVAPASEPGAGRLANNPEINILLTQNKTQPFDQNPNQRQKIIDNFGYSQIPDSLTIANLESSVSWAAYERAWPRGVNVTVLPEKTNFPGGCFDDSYENAKTDAIRETYQELFKNVYPLIQKGAVNVLVTDALDCSPEPRKPGWYYPDKDLIFVSGNGLELGLENIVPHEIGHWTGLPHAGVMDCRNPIKMQDCSINPTADQNSIMSYRGIETEPIYQQFSTPELAVAGLLPNNKIITNPMPGAYNLQSEFTDTPELNTGASLLKDTFITPDGPREVEIAVEHDYFRPRTITCSTDETPLEPGQRLPIMELIHNDEDISEKINCQSKPRKYDKGSSTVKIRMVFHASDMLDGKPAGDDTRVLIDSKSNDVMLKSGEWVNVFGNGYEKAGKILEDPYYEWYMSDISVTNKVTIIKKPKNMLAYAISMGLSK